MSTLPPAYASHSMNAPHTTLKPYLTLPHLLSLTWLAYPILSLLFVAFRLFLSSTSAQDAVSDAKGNLLLSCQAAEQAATAAASLPRYMAVATNEQIADAVNSTMNGARAALVLSLTVMEAIINFVIDIYRSTFLCFLELIVQGGLAILIGAVQEINTFLTSTFSTIRTSIQNDISTANSAIATAIGAINKINPFGNISVPSFSIPSLSLLENVTLPTDFETALVNLNNSIPTPSQLKNLIDDFVDTPFELLKADINNTFGNLTFDSSVLPIPDQNRLSFCNQLDTSVVDDLGQDLLKATKIGVIILIVLAFLLLGAHCCLEWYKWRCMRRHLELTRQSWTSDPAIQQVNSDSSQPTLQMTDDNLLILAADSSHPLLTYISNRIASIFHLSPAKYIHLRWFLHYVFHPPALACFLIGFLGLLSVELQLLAISPLEAKYSSQVAASVTDFSNTIATQINSSMYNQSSQYADSINTRVATIQGSVNDGLFGWVNGTTSTLNDTLNDFYSDIQNAVAFVFNGTILEDPVQDFIKCIIGSKVEALEDALTFLHNNLNIDLPQVNESVLVLSPSDVNEAVQPISRAAVGSGSDGDGGIVGTIVNRYVQSLKTERIMFSIFIGLWGIVVIMAIAILLYHSYLRPWLERRRSRQSEKEDGVAYTVDRFTHSDGFANEKNAGLPSFNPLSPQNGTFLGSRSPSPFLSRNAQESFSLAPHPLTTLQPNYERSWDSILDSSAENQAIAAMQNAKSSKRPPRKLLSLSKKARGTEILVSDEERARMDAEEIMRTNDKPVEEKGWWSRLFSPRQKLSNDNPDEATDQTFPFPPGLAPEDRRQGRPKPQLTISIDRAAPTESSSITVVDSSEAVENAPGSAWSVSPGPPKTLPWLPLHLHTMSKRPPTNVTIIRPSPRRNVSVPTSIGSMDSPSMDERMTISAKLGIPSNMAFQKPPQTPASVSSYAPGAIYQAYQTSSYIPPLPTSYKGSANPPPGRPVPTSGKASGTVQHARKSSHVVDPFRTPFDDEAGINKVTNPFEVVVA